MSAFEIWVQAPKVSGEGRVWVLHELTFCPEEAIRIAEAKMTEYPLFLASVEEVRL